MARPLSLPFVALAGLCGPVVAWDKPVESPAPPPDLTAYVGRQDPAFSWKVVGKTEVGGATIYNLSLVSQKWHDVVWDHDLQVVVPKGFGPKPTMVLWNQGGTASTGSTAMAVAIADRVKAPVAFLYGVPKQPLYGGKKEDALIAETFVRYLDTGDGTWPLLFPMVKSVVRAMDAVQAFAKEEWKADVTGFVVTGGSKRGWTGWLTAATGDRRVKAIAPLVIDTLNFQLQMPNQLKSFGKFSEMIRDYEERKLLPLPDTATAKRLWAMVDPWVYRAKLTLPKMIINGTNDPYWAQDALNYYWDDLPGDKRVCYVPNAGHDLRPQDRPNQPKAAKEAFPMKGINTLSAFCRAQIEGTPLPKLTWKPVDKDGGRAGFAVSADQAAKELRLWQASSNTRDFRQAKWSVVPTNGSQGAEAELLTDPPTAGFKAVLVEAEFEANGLPFTLCTQIRILEAKK